MIGISAYEAGLLAVMCSVAGILIRIAIVAPEFCGSGTATAATEGSWAVMECRVPVSTAPMGRVIRSTPISNVLYGLIGVIWTIYPFGQTVGRRIGTLHKAKHPIRPRRNTMIYSLNSI